MRRFGPWVSIVLLLLATTATAPSAADNDSRWDSEGDFRIRYEGNSERKGAPERHRGVLRFRLGVNYEINHLFTVGARVVTGDPDNPRTADVTIGDFLDDLELSLDRAYVAMRHDNLIATAGKFANPFVSTELVWDGDVNPTGAAGSLDLASGSGGYSSTFTGILMLVDEQSLGDDSSMWGLQYVLTRNRRQSFGVQVAAAYWDYQITDMAHVADAGDLRGNLLNAAGTAHQSDFNLADLNVTVTFPGFGPHYPVRVVADLVKNLGAAVDEDQGFGIDVFVGSSWVEDHFELRYGYAECETDAVLGAYSHDNIPFATNYQSHVLRLSYGWLEDTSLSLTWYSFSRLHEDQRYPEERPGDFSSRIRLDLMLRF